MGSREKSLAPPLAGRCDSFVVETDVHYPTDVSLLWDALRCLIRAVGPCGGEERCPWLAPVEAPDAVGAAVVPQGAGDAPCV